MACGGGEGRVWPAWEGREKGVGEGVHVGGIALNGRWCMGITYFIDFRARKLIQSFLD